MASLTADELREHVTTALGDTALELLLEAAWQAIAVVAGAEGDGVEVRPGGTSVVFLPRAASAIDTVKEWLGFSYERTLDATDYRLETDGVSVYRLASGLTPARYWQGPVELSFTAVDDEASRQLVQIALVRLFLDHHPGVQEEEIGDWRERFENNSDWNYATERDAILATLRARPLEFA
jgi:hypothetical protein